MVASNRSRSHGHWKRASTWACAGLLPFFLLSSEAQSQNCFQPPPGAIAWWSLDESEGNVATERFGRFDGAFTNGPVPVTGHVRGALECDGADDYVTVQDDDTWTFAGDFTIELWASLDAPGGSIGHPEDIFIGHDEGPGTRNKWFFALGGGFLNFHINGPGVGSHFFPLVPFSPVVGQWYHLAVTRRGTLWTIYVNGVAAGAEVNPVTIPNANAPLTIGQGENLGYVDGRLDEVTIYDRALAVEELRAIFVAGSSGKCIDLRVSPTQGGNSGDVTLQVSGAGFADSAIVELARPAMTIPALAVATSQRGTHVSARFDLRSQPVGAWDVVVRNPGGVEYRLPLGFTIEQGGAPRVWVRLVGLGLIRPGRPQSFHVFYGNSGNVDAIAVPLWVAGIPADADVDIVQAIELPRPLEDPAQDYSAVPILASSGTEKTLPVVISSIPAGGTGTLDFKLTIAQPEPLQLRAWMTAPFVTPNAGGTPLRVPQASVSPEEISIDVLGCAISLAEHVFGEVLDELSGNDCAKAAMSNAISVWVNDGPDRLKNLGAAVLDIGIQCAVQSACAICTGARYGPSCVVCIAGKLVQNYQALVDGWNLSVQCGNAAFRAAESLLDVTPIASYDPNEKAGPAGVGALEYTAGDGAMPYTVFFENLAAATAPVQELVVTDSLDAVAFDLTTVTFGPISFGSRTVVPPAGATAYWTEVDLRPENNLIVQVRSTADAATGVLTWRLTAVDPVTGDLPEDPLAGFLPPNTNPPAGEGSVLFSARLRPAVSTGDVVSNRAVIAFDTNAPIETPVWFNSIDQTKPESSVLPQPMIQSSATDSVSFLVEWSGTDVGSGIQAYTLYISDNDMEGDGPFAPWIQTAATSAVFVGAVGHRYGFYSVARDSVGNLEDAPAAPDVTVDLTATEPCSMPIGLVAYYPLDGNAIDATGNGRNGVLFGDVVPAADRQGNPSGAMAFDGYGDFIKADATGLPSGERTVSLWFFASDVDTKPIFMGYGGAGCGTYWFAGLNSCGTGDLHVSTHCGINSVQWFYPSPPVGQWRHLTVTTSSTGTRFYLDGVQVYDSMTFVSGTVVEGRDLGIGVATGNDGMAPYTDGCIGFFQGRLDDLQIYDRELTPEEVIRLYTCTPTDALEGLRAPLVTRLHQNVPNPFNPSTQISVDVALPGRVEIDMYDVNGRSVRRLIDRRLDAGTYRFEWNGRNDAGRKVASGVYYYQLRVNGVVIGTDRAVMIR